MIFKEGDVVSLQTGGPLMTVEDIRQDNIVATVWFDRGRVRRDCFEPVHLWKWERIRS